jgi:HEAT repeat protein
VERGPPVKWKRGVCKKESYRSYDICFVILGEVMFTTFQRYSRLFICLTICGMFVFFRALDVAIGYSYQTPEYENNDQYIKQLKDPDAGVETRQRAVEELGRTQTKSAEVIHQLAETLREDPDSNIRSAAAISLGNTMNETKQVIPYLRAALVNREEEKDPKVRYSAAIALGGMFSEADTIIPILNEAMKGESEAGVRRELIFLIGRFGAAAKSVIPGLIDDYKASLDNEKTIKGKREQYIEDYPAPSDVTKQKAYNDQIWKKFDSSINELSSERIQIAESLVLISNGLVEKKDIEALNLVKDAYAKIERDDELADQAKLLNKNISRLESLGHTPLLATFYLVIIFIALPLGILLIVWLAVLLTRPLWLFQINEFLASIPEVKVEKLGGITLSIRYLILVGFFHHNQRVLDAWISKYLDKAQVYFNRKQTVADRAVHVPLGLLLDRQLIDEFRAQIFQDIFSHPQSRILIFGEGGAGKTSLACQFANWAMKRERSERLCQAHAMLPILIEQDFERSSIEQDFKNSLLKVISDQLTDMIDATEAPPQQLLKQLLKRKRIIVIADGMSEMNDTTRSSILFGITELPVNSIIITSRFDEALKGLSKTVIEPIRLQSLDVDGFINTYLNKLNKDNLFDADEIQNRCEHLHEMIGEGRDLTVILAKYYALNMIAAKEGYTDGDLPENIPCLMVNYIRLINRKPGPKATDTNTLIRVAEVIAWECLKTKYRPIPAKLDDVLEALSNKQQELSALKNIRDEGEKTEIIQNITKYMENDLRLIQTYGARQDRIRFALDTLSEYLAALFLVREYGSSEKEWVGFFASTDEKFVDQRLLQRALKDEVVDRKENLPDAILSFLLALYDCCSTEEASGLIPDFVLNELRRKIIIRRIIRDLRSTNAEHRRKALEEFERTELVSLALTQKFIIPAIIELLADSELKTRNTAKEVLMKLGDLAVPELTSASRREESELGITALRLLVKIRGITG